MSTIASNDTVYTQPYPNFNDPNYIRDFISKELEKKVLYNIYSLKKSISAIIVSHNRNVLSGCDKVIKLN